VVRSARALFTDCESPGISWTRGVRATDADNGNASTRSLGFVMKTDSTLEGELRLAVLKAAFDRLAPELERFAELHSLHIERYKRGFSMWAFSLRHPKGGMASLQLSINLARDTGDLRATVLAHWWVDIADEQRRLAAEFPAQRLISADDTVVIAALGRELARLMAAHESALTRESWTRRRAECLPPQPP
jgi:hypothetical protein